MIVARIVDSDGVEFSASYDHDGQAGRDILTGLSGWTGGVGIRSEDVARLSHGSFPTPSTRTGRTLTVDMLFERDTRAELWALERAASGLFSDGGYGLLTVTQDSTELFCEVRLDGEVKPIVNLDGGFMTLQVPLRAPSPFLYGPERTVFLHPVGISVGLRFPLFVPGCLDFGDAIDTDAPVTNQGNATAHPTVLVAGDFPGGFRLTVNGRTVEWPWPTVLAAPVLVEMTGRIWIGDSNVTDRASVRQWAPLAPGATVTPSLTPLQGGTGWAEVRHRDTYI